MGIFMMNKILVTGVTGLVGSAFVVALLRERQDYDIVCLVRSGGGKSAAERVDSIIRDECAFDGCPDAADAILKKIQVVEGDVVGINPQELAKNPAIAGANIIFHCAADVNLGKDPTGKVFKINYGGTQNMVELAKLLNVKEFHYVGTCYIAGKLCGTAYEDNPVDNGFNNPYEESKFKAEQLVRQSGIPFSVYRPAIITGRRSDGRIRKPLAFYRILEFLGKVKSHRCSKLGISPENWVNMEINFATNPSEHVYFVPIDYVQEAITALFQKPVTNSAYHISGDSPVSVKQIEHTICKVLRLDGTTVGGESKGDGAGESLMSRFVGDLFPYFSSDIVFDQSNVRKVLGDAVLDWEFGEKGLEIMIKSFYEDYFPNVEWLRKVISEEPDRMPIR
ncbi:MAG: NAD-dependent epimerase/dehydratase family protein [Lentisphaerae bacterium]|nr:NAD-dependent epimerase/dehydratase family protein [Lentisphaerota bacterium]